MCKKLYTIVLLFFTILISSLAFSSCDFNDASDDKHYLYHKQNIEELTNTLERSIATSVVTALEQTHAIEEDAKLDKKDLIKIDDNCYELYAGLMTRFYIDSDDIRLYTYETSYSEESKILLYDTSLQGVIKVLASAERSSLIYTQRQTAVQSTLEISPCEGFLLHNALGATKIDLTISNKSNFSITYLSMVITPRLSGALYSYNSKGYVLDCELPVSGSICRNISTTGWTQYDSYKITKVIVMFSDGETIEFDSFDCQFLNGHINGIIDADIDSNNPDGSTEKLDNITSECIVRFVQGDGLPDIEFQVKKNGKLENIPDPQPVEGFNVQWEEFDYSNISSDLVVNSIKTPIEYTITFHIAEQIQRSTFTILDLPLELQEAEHTTDIFSGWYNDVNHNGEVVEIINSIGNRELYADFVSGTKGLQFSKNADGYEVCKYVGSETSIVVPAVYKGKNVTEIAPKAFFLAKIVEIELPETLLKIGYEAFDNCHCLCTISIPDSVTIIEYEAFAWCVSLTSLSLGNSVEKIGYRVFSGCSALESVFVDDLENWFSIEFDYDGNPIKFADNFYVNNELLTELYVPEWVTNIKFCAFLGYDKLTKVILGENVEEIERCAFQSCINLSEVIFNDKLKIIGESAFNDCIKLTSIFLNDSLETIGSEAFSISWRHYVTGGRRVVLPKSLKSVGYDSFDNISSFEYKGSIEDWCYISFGNYEWFDTRFNTLIYIDGKVLCDVEIPNGVPSILAYAFSGWRWLETISIPNSVSQIGERAFWGCYSLKSVFFDIESQLKIIGREAFSSCDLTNILLPDKLETIGWAAFACCSKLSQLIIPETVSSIEHDAFNYCTNLTIYCKTQNAPDGWDSCWNRVYSSSSSKDNIQTYWYSDVEPNLSGCFWHYGKDDEILIWEN